MQLANIMLAIGGDKGNTVPKHGVTASEIAVLRSIHGEDAVQEVDPAGIVGRSHREEIKRLLALYGKEQDGKDISPVSVLFPGAAARTFETLEELGLPEHFFKAEKRVSADSAPVAAAVHEESRVFG